MCNLHVLCGWSYYFSSYNHPFYLFSTVFSPLHDKHFETNENISCKTDESIILYYNTIHQLIWWVEKSNESIFLIQIQSFFWRKLQLIFLSFVHYRVNQLRYFWWNYFLNNFKLLDALLRLVCLLMVYNYFIIIMIQHL